MKLIVLSILILIFYYFTRSTEEAYAISADNVFKQVEIPDASKDPYYQKIKNMTFDCGIKCPDGQKVDTSGSCVCINNDEEVVNGVCKCKQGFTRGSNGVCYPPCLDEQTRDFDGVCKWLPCPEGETREAGNKCYPPCPFNIDEIYPQQYRDGNGVCQWLPCLNGGTRQPDGRCIPNCNEDQTYNSLTNQCVCNDPDKQTYYPERTCKCKPGLELGFGSQGYKCVKRCNYGYKVWYDSSPECTPICNNPERPYYAPNEICYKDYLEYLNTTNPCPSSEQTRNSLSVCVWKPCPTDKTRDSSGVCQWNTCPSGQIRDLRIGSSTYEKCILNECPTGQIRNLTGDNKCYPPCETDKSRDAVGTCQWNACAPEQTRDLNIGSSTYGKCLWNPCDWDKYRNSSGVCQCKPEFYEAYGRCFSDYYTYNIYLELMNNS